MSVESSLLFFCMRIHILKRESSENNRRERSAAVSHLKGRGLVTVFLSSHDRTATISL